MSVLLAWLFALLYIKACVGWFLVARRCDRALRRLAVLEGEPHAAAMSARMKER